MKILLLDSECSDLVSAMQYRGWETEQPRQEVRCGGLLDTPRAALRIRRLVERSDPDLIWVSNPLLLPAAAWARTRKPVVFHARRYMLPGWAREAAVFALGRMDAHVIANCEYAADPWRHGVSTERLHVVYPGVSGPARMSAQRAGGPPRIACIGRIAPREFVAAASRIHEALPGCRFILYGAAPARRGAEGLRIHFAGQTDDVHRAMTSLDLLLVPSGEHETVPRVILEAFAAGLPVVAFASGGIPEVIESGVNGLLASDAADMATRAIVLLTGDPRRLISIAQCARQCWERIYTLERYQQEMLRIVAAAGRGGAHGSVEATGEAWRAGVK